MLSLWLVLVWPVPTDEWAQLGVVTTAQTGRGGGVDIKLEFYYDNYIENTKVEIKCFLFQIDIIDMNIK